MRREFLVAQDTVDAVPDAWFPTKPSASTVAIVGLESDTTGRCLSGRRWSRVLAYEREQGQTKVSELGLSADRVRRSQRPTGSQHFHSDWRSASQNSSSQNVPILILSVRRLGYHR